MLATAPVKEYEEHPLSAAYPPLTPKEVAKLKLALTGAGPYPTVTLYEGKILAGWPEYLLAVELEIELPFESPEIKDPLAYVIKANEGRRNLGKTDKVLLIEKFLALFPSIAERGLTQAEIAKRVGSSAASLIRFRTTQAADVHPAVRAAVIERKLSICAGFDIVHYLPKDYAWKGLKEALREAKLAKGKYYAELPSLKKSRVAKAPREVKAKEIKNGRRKYWQEWKKLRPALCEQVTEKSIYPAEAKIPQGDTPDEKFVRNAIEALRRNEAGLPSYSKTELDNLIYPYTQAIQTYVINRDKRPRPEGELDSRFWDWARRVAKRMLSLQDFYNYRYVEQKKKEAEAEIEKAPKKLLPIFELYFHDLWEASVPILKRFPLSDLEKLKARWLEQTDKYFTTRAHRAHTQSKAPKAT